MENMKTGKRTQEEGTIEGLVKNPACVQIGSVWYVVADEVAPLLARASLASRLAEALNELKSVAWGTSVQQLMYQGHPIVKEANDVLREFSSLNEGDGGKT